MSSVVLNEPSFRKDVASLFTSNSKLPWAFLKFTFEECMIPIEAKLGPIELRERLWKEYYKDNHESIIDSMLEKIACEILFQFQDEELREFQRDQVKGMRLFQTPLQTRVQSAFAQYNWIPFIDMSLDVLREAFKCKYEFLTPVISGGDSQKGREAIQVYFLEKEFAPFAP